MEHARRIEVRAATETDVELVCGMIHALAEYERLAHECRATPAALHEHLFGPRRVAEALVGSIDGVPRGFALYFTTFSTFACRPGIWLEDLFVQPQARGAGLGKVLLVELARIASARGAARLEWTVLTWNEPALAFYASQGARRLDGWVQHRVEGAALEQLAHAR